LITIIIIVYDKALQIDPETFWLELTKEL